MSAGFDRDRLSRNFAVFSSIQYLTEGCGVTRPDPALMRRPFVIALPVLIKWIAKTFRKNGGET